MLKALVCQLLTLCFVLGAVPAFADPPAPSPFPVPPPRVFCFRVTDIESHPSEPNRFKIQVEFLNWTNQPAYGTYIWLNNGTTALHGGPPTLVDAGVDPDGRGGPLGGQHIGPGLFNSPAHHSGRGRGDIPGHLNDWNLVFRGATSVYWGDDGSGPAITPIPFRSLLTVPSAAAQFALVPGLGNDGLLTSDSAVDGGPPIYGPPTQPAPFPAGGPPTPDGSGNVLDGFWFEVADFHEGEVLSMNWILADQNGSSLGQVGAQGNVVGNEMGFGLFNLVRIPTGADLPPGVFQGNSGFSQGINFFRNVYFVPDAPGGTTAEFGVEFGAALLAPPLSPEVADEVPTSLPPTLLLPDINPNDMPPNATPSVCSLQTPADVNLSGVVNVADVQCILLVAAWELNGSQAGQQPVCFTAPRAAGDLNCDGSITVSDVQLGVMYAFNQPLSVEVDGNGNRCHDNCDCSAELCDDGNACTVDQCDLTGQCQNLPTSCSDGDPCTIDTCSPSIGCIFASVGCEGAPGCAVPDGAPCDDGNACTSGDLCQGGQCAGSTIGCDDDNPCTTDGCAPSSGCTHTILADGSACGAGFQCVTGTCVQPANCATNADCASLGDACRTFACVDTSTPGVKMCAVSWQANCNDLNPCTDDSCNPSSGCIFTPLTELPCSDGDVCTIGDECVVGNCVGTGFLCDDNNPCTTDFCDSDTGCYSTPLHAVPCEDGTVCTADDVCVHGFCVGQPVVCSDNDLCTTDSCHSSLGCQFSPIICEDSNPCTDNLCEPASGCTYPFNTAPCNDNNACTTNDGCSAGTCSGNPLTCDDGIACTSNGCNPATGCIYQPDNALCDDSDPCTSGTCDPSLGCVQSPVANCSTGTDCYSILQSNPAADSGVYLIDPDGDGGAAPFEAYCDMESDGGGWTKLMSAQWAHFFTSGNWQSLNITSPASANYSALMHRFALYGQGNQCATWRFAVGNSGNWLTGPQAHFTVWEQCHDPFTASTNGSDYTYIAGETSTTCGGFNGLHHKYQGYSFTTDADLNDNVGCWWMQVVPHSNYDGLGYLEGYGGYPNYHQWQSLWIRPALSGSSSLNPGTTCNSIYTADPDSPSGLYWLDPDGAGGVAPFRAYCEMGLGGGGWTLIESLTRDHIANGLAYSQIGWDRDYPINEGAPSTGGAFRFSFARIDALRSASAELAATTDSHLFSLDYWRSTQARNWMYVAGDHLQNTHYVQYDVLNFKGTLHTNASFRTWMRPTSAGWSTGGHYCLDDPALGCNSCDYWGFNATKDAGFAGHATAASRTHYWLK